MLEPIAARHPLYEPCTPLPELASATDHVMDHTFISGEGWLIPGEIREYPMCWRINWCFPPDRTKRYGGGRGDIPYSMQGLGEYVIPLVSSSLEMIEKVIIAMTLVPLLGYTGVIVAEPIVWFIMVIPLIIKIFRMPVFEKKTV